MTINTAKTKNNVVTCKDCINFDGTICDYNGLLCSEDDIPKLRCGGKGFEAWEAEGYFGKRNLVK